MPKNPYHDISETIFQSQIIAAARLYHWRIVHHRPALNRSGKWSTPMEGDKGFPDLVLAKNGYVILAELKSNTGKLGPGQQEWLTELGEHARLWRPRDWNEIVQELSAKHTPKNQPKILAAQQALRPGQLTTREENPWEH
jgi:hypothetical protein